jgi:hypothetical protein
MTDGATDVRVLTRELRAAPDDDLAGRSTCFADPQALDGWEQLEVDGWAPKWRRLEVVDGVLEIEPAASGWFEDNVGGLLFQHVEGDFVATARLQVSGTERDWPQTLFSLGGLFVRRPRVVTAESWRPGQENCCSSRSVARQRRDIRSSRSSCASAARRPGVIRAGRVSSLERPTDVCSLRFRP